MSHLFYEGTMADTAGDDELYRRYLSGEVSAGDELMERYADALIAYLYSFVHNRQDAEDLMLECFTVILADRPKIAAGCFRAYLFRMAHHKACSLWKRILRRMELPFYEGALMDADGNRTDGEKLFPDGLNWRIMEEAERQIVGEAGIRPAENTDPENVLWLRDRAAVLHKCLNRIPEQYREALWLVYAGGFSHEQTAQVLNCNRKRINNLITNGKKALREELKKEGFCGEDV